MAFIHIDLALSTGNNDGTTWADAYQDMAGLTAAMAAGGAGDILYVKNTSTDSSASRFFVGPTSVASMTDPMILIGVKSATTNEGGSIVQSDIIPGIRTGDSTPAHAQTAGNAPPLVDISASGSFDLWIEGNLYFYAITFKSGDNLIIANTNVNPSSVIRMEECMGEVIGPSDTIQFGGNSSQTPGQVITLVNCLMEASSGDFFLQNSTTLDAFNCEFNSTFAGSLRSREFGGRARFYGCDLSGLSASGIVEINDIHDGVIEFWNCKFPASHVLVTGTATQSYTVTNYGSEDNTGHGSSDSEQAFEYRTHPGNIDVETTIVRTGGSNDGATGAFAWAIVANNVADNFVGVVLPWLRRWVKGDGTAKTLKLFFCNDDAEAAGNLLEDDEIFLEVCYPSEAGISQFDCFPDEASPGNGVGRMELLGTPADIATDGSTWGTGGNNKQAFSVSIAPDYEGPIFARVHFSKSATPPTLYVDPKLEVA